MVQRECGGRSTLSQNLSAAQICQWAKRGDGLAMRAVDREAYYLGLGLANLINLFVPDVIVLGGSVMRVRRFFLMAFASHSPRVCRFVPFEKDGTGSGFLGRGRQSHRWLRESGTIASGRESARLRDVPPRAAAFTRHLRLGLPVTGQSESVGSGREGGRRSLNHWKERQLMQEAAICSAWCSLLFFVISLLTNILGPIVPDIVSSFM